MANIKEYTDEISNARYGKDVRSSIVGAIEAVNTESEDSVKRVNETIEVVKGAVRDAMDALDRANDLADRTDEILDTAEQFARAASDSEAVSGQNAENAANHALKAQSYTSGGTGIRENEEVDNAQYYYRQAKQISQSLNGVIPNGTLTFADLPTEGMTYGDMYNISNAFLSDERFNDGGGVYYGPGNNVVWISGDMWDVTAGSSVTGIKGAKQSMYQQGNVSLSAADVGAVENGGDTAENIVAFTSEDDTSPNAWTDVAALKSGEKHKNILGKISTMFKNVRWLYKMLGTADISAIGGGTVTGAIAEQNNNFTNKYNELNNSLGAILKNIVNGTQIEATFTNSTKTNINTITLSKGLWLLIGQVDCKGNASTVNDVADISLYGNILSGNVSLICPNEWRWERKQVIAIHDATSNVTLGLACTPYYSPSKGQIYGALNAIKIS